MGNRECLLHSCVKFNRADATIKTPRSSLETSDERRPHLSVGKSSTLRDHAAMRRRQPYFFAVRYRGNRHLVVSAAFLLLACHKDTCLLTSCKEPNTSALMS